jgi:hypothetical protein
MPPFVVSWLISFEADRGGGARMYSLDVCVGCCFGVGGGGALLRGAQKLNLWGLGRGSGADQRFFRVSVGYVVGAIPVFGAEAGFGRESVFPVLILLG